MSPGDERGGLAEAARGRGQALLVGRAWHGAGPRGHQQALGVVLAAAAAQAVVAVLAEAATPQAAHQALGHHIVETLPVLLGDEDPEERTDGGRERRIERG